MANRFKKPGLFIVCPHPDNFDSPDLIKNLVNESMLDVDSP